MDEFSRALNSVRAYLESDRAAGAEVLLRVPSENRPSESGGPQLNLLEEAAEKCRACLLHKSRTKLVFGAGDPRARLMFVGEAPGEDEDLQGEPFVGRAGQLLTKMIEAMELKRTDVYIANILKCRPPNNRPPQPEEIAACSGFISGQLGTIKPRVVCALGKFAAQFLLGTDEPISALRGRFHKSALAGGVNVMPTFHPAYILRNPASKRQVWEDLKKIMKEIA